VPNCWRSKPDGRVAGNLCAPAVQAEERESGWPTRGRGPTTSASSRPWPGRQYWHALLDTRGLQERGRNRPGRGTDADHGGPAAATGAAGPRHRRAVHEGCQPRRLTLLWLMRNDIPALWPEQRQMLEQIPVGGEMTSKKHYGKQTGRPVTHETPNTRRRRAAGNLCTLDTGEREG
jgi:hypothetical protein